MKAAGSLDIGFEWFNRKFDRMNARYESGVARIVKRSGRVMLVFAVLVGLLAFGFRLLPASFLPEEDQGYFITSIQLPSDASTERTLDIVKKFEDHLVTRNGISNNQSILGWSFTGSGPNAAIAFTIELFFSTTSCPEIASTCQRPPRQTSTEQRSQPMRSRP